MSEIYSWIKQGLIAEGRQQDALQVAGERAERDGWLQFIRRLLLFGGVLSLAFGVVFFFAYNWNDMSRAVKFGILQGLLLSIFLLYFFKAHNEWVRQALLLMGVLVLGALLALFGQTYQTGADPWQLFATWALLITPIVIVGKSETLWIFLTLLLNVSLSLYLDVHRSIFGWVFFSYRTPWLYVLLNGLLLVLFEWLNGARVMQQVSLKHRWPAQIVGLVSLYALTVISFEVVFGNNDGTAVNFLFYVFSMIGLIAYYRLVKVDLLLLTGWALAVIFFILSVLAQTVFDHFDAGGLLLMALCLIGLTTAAVGWLKNIHREAKSETINKEQGHA